MFLIAGVSFLALLSITLFMLWAHEKITNKKIISRARVEEYWTGEERRQHVRFKKGLEVEYRVEKKPHLKKSSSVDISKGGMRLLLEEKLQIGEILDLKIFIIEKARIIEVEAEVVWTKDIDKKDPLGRRLFHSGVKFIAINEPYDTHLSDYIQYLEAQNTQG